MVKEILRLFQWSAPQSPVDELARAQAAALAIPPVKSQSAQVKEAQKRIPYRPRLTYAEAQAKWEYEHNKAARDAAQRAKDGFF